MTLCDPPKDSDLEVDNRRHSVPIKIHMESKVDTFKLFHMLEIAIYYDNLTRFKNFIFKYYSKYIDGPRPIERFMWYDGRPSQNTTRSFKGVKSKNKIEES